MGVSRMDSDATAVDRLPAFQPLTPVSTVGEAAAHLRATGEQVAVVMRAGRPVGLVSAEPVLEAVRSGDSDALVQSMLDYVAVPVPPRADAQEVLEAFNRAAWDWLRSPSRSSRRNGRGLHER
jgi:hypothetical protein